MSENLINRIRAVNSMGPWITLDLSAECSLNCIMCRARSVDSCKEPFMDLELFEYLVHDIFASGLRFRGMKLSWLGESTLHPGFYRAVDMISATMPADALAIETNLQGMTPEAVEAIGRCSQCIPVFLTCSIDAVEADTYKLIRKGGDFEQVCRAVENLKRVRSRNRGMLYLRYQFVLMPENRHELDRFIVAHTGSGAEGPFFEEQIKMPRDLVYIRRLIDPERQAEADRLFYTERSRILSGRAEMALLKGQPTFGYRKQQRDVVRSHGQIQASGEENDIAGALCTKPWTMVFVRPDGTLRYCDQDPGGYLGMPDIGDRGFVKTWLEGTAHDFRFSMARDGFVCFEHCQRCPAPAQEIEDYKLASYLDIPPDQANRVIARPEQSNTATRESNRSEQSNTVTRESDRAIANSIISCELNWSHQNAACLMENGELLHAVESERIRRVRYYNDLDIETSSSGVSIVKPRAHWGAAVSHVCRGLKTLPKDFEALADVDHYMAGDHPFSPHPEHHIAHAACAYWLSGFDRAAVLTVDAVGYLDETATLSLAANNRIRKLASINLPHSLGRFYILIGNWLGLAPQPEGKLMALSSYGDERYIPLFREIVKSVRKGFILSSDYISSPPVGKRGEIYQPSLTRLFERQVCAPRKPGEPLTDIHYAVARATQTVLEEALLSLCNWLYDITGESNLCYAGGVALNCVANRRLLDEGPFKRLFIPPAPDDSGLAAGYAFYHHYVTASEYDISPNKAFLSLEHARAVGNRKLMKASAIALADRRKIYPGSIGAVSGLEESARAFQELGLFRRAKDALEKALALGADDLSIFWMLADVLERLGNIDKAMRICRRAVRKHPKSWEAWHRWGLLLASKKLYKKAIHVYRRALKLSDNNELSVFETGCTLLHLSRIKPKQNREQEGLELLRSISDSPLCGGKASLEIARWLREKNCHAEASDWYYRAMKYQELEVEALTGLGGMLIENQRPEEAELTLNQAIRKGPNADTLYYVARIYEERGDFKTAFARYREALEIDPAHEPADRGSRRVSIFLDEFRA